MATDFLATGVANSYTGLKKLFFIWSFYTDIMCFNIRRFGETLFWALMLGRFYSSDDFSDIIDIRAFEVKLAPNSILFLGASLYKDSALFI